MPTRSPSRVLLLQVRPEGRASRQERECFENACGDLARLSYQTLVNRPDVRWSDVRDQEVLMIGGSGEHSATKEHHFTAALEGVVRRWVEESRPFFGSCWGHQFLARTLGGVVRTDPSTREIGTFPVELEGEGAVDPLFSTLPKRFLAQMGHHDWVAELPPSAIPLARSETCANQAMKLHGKPIYSTQFHSELGKPEILERIEIYRKDYLDGTLEEMERRLQPSPAVRPLLRRFLALYT